MSDWERILDTFFKHGIIEKYLPSIIKGMMVRLELAGAIVVMGLCLGLCLAGIRSFGWRLANLIIIAFSDIFRALPPLVAILLIYFGLPNVGIYIGSFSVIWIVLSFVLSA